VILAAVLSAPMFSSPSHAQVITSFAPRFSANVAGDITFIGNSLETCPSTAVNCANARQGVGSVVNNNDFNMTYIDVDADTTTFNSSRASLNLPAGAQVLFAGLYWGADLSAGTNGRAAPTPANNRNIKFQVPGSLTYLDLGPNLPAGNPYGCSELGRSAFGATINYAAFCDVTPLVQSAGNGGYTVANVQAGTGENRYAGWSMAIVYKYAGEPSRNLTVFQGYSIVSGSNTVTIPVTGFRAPPAGAVNAKIGVMAYEGDIGLTGDSLKLNGQTLSDALNPATNFFNSNITLLGSAYTARTPDYPNIMAVDANIVNTTNIIANNATSATIVTSTSGDTFFPLVITSAIEIYAPKINATKTAVDLNGGQLLPGDVVQYSINVSNTGQDNANSLVLTDVLPAGTSFVAGSLIINGSPAGALAEYDSGNNLVRFRLGSGATASQGGTLGVNASTTVGFQVRVNANAQDELLTSNVGNISFTAGTTGTPLSATSNQTNLTVARPVLVLSKSASPNPVQAGSDLVYRLSYRNDGTAPAVNAQIVDTLPGGTTHVSNSLGAVPAGQVLTLPLGNVPPGASGAINVVVRVDSSVANAAVLTNRATLSANGETPVTVTQSTTAISEPYLTLVKTASLGVVGAGRKIIYTLDFTNAGTDVARNVMLQDAVPANTQFVSASSGGALAGSTVSWSLGDIPAGGSGSVSMIVQVNNGAAVDTIITNSAGIAGDNTNTANASATTRVVAEAVLDLVKTPAMARVPAGSLLTYTLNFSNIGTDIAQNVVLYDQLQPYQRFVSSSGGGQYDTTTNTVTWVIGGLAAQQSGGVTLTLFVQDGLEDGTFIRNKATLTSSSVASVESDTQVVVYTQPQLVLQKAASADIVAPGDTLVFTLSYANTGSGNAAGAFIVDTLPAFVQFSSASGGATVTGNEVRWSLGNLPAGASGSVTLTVVVDSPLPNGTQIVNTATINTPDPMVQPASASSTSQVSIAPQLVLNKTAQSPIITTGEQLTYTISYSNAGNDVATNVVLSDELPTDTTFVSASVGGVYNSMTGKVTWQLPDIQPNDGGSVTLTVMLSNGLLSGQRINNIASISADNTPPVSASVATEVNVTPVLTVVKTADKSVVQAGGTLNYTLTLANTGNAAATGVTLLDHLPSITGGAQPVFSGSGVYDPAAHQISWDIGTVGVGEVQTYTVQLAIPSPLADGTIVDNEASVSSNELPQQSTHQLTTVSSAPQLEIGKTADQNPVLANGALTYTISYANNGSDDAVNVVLTENIPVHTGFVSASGSYSQSGDILSWNLGTLPAGASGSVTLTVLVDNGLTNGTLLNNTATLDADNAQPASIALQTTVSSAARLAVDKRTNPAGKATAQAGDAINYVIQYSNTGTADALNAVLVDILPQGMTFVSASPPQDSAVSQPNGTTVVTWNLGTLPFGANASISMDVSVNTPIANGSVLNNRVNLSADDVQPVSGVVSIVAQSQPVLGLAKSSDVSNPFTLSGTGVNLINYTLSYSNAGSDDATTVTLTDTLPDNVIYQSANAGGAYNAANHQVVWNLGTVAAGASGSITLTVQVPVPMLDGTLLQNSATIQSVDGFGALLSQVSADNSITVDTAPGMTLTKTAAIASVPAGNQNTFAITISNDANATDAIRSWSITDVLDSRFQFVSASTGTYDPATRTLSSTGGNIMPGTSSTVLVVVQSPAIIANGTSISNTASAQANNATTRTASASFMIDSAAMLNLAKTVSKSPITPGESFSYRLTYSNTGSADAANVVLTDTLPANVTFIGASSAPNSQIGQVLTWNIGTLAAGTSAAIDINVQAGFGLINGAVLSNTARITDGILTQQASADVTVDSDPLMTLTKRISGSPALKSGTSLTYVISYDINGNDAVNNLVINDPLPTDVTFISATNGGIYDPGTHTVSWAIGNQTVGSSGSVSVTVAIGNSVVGGTILLNDAVASSSNATTTHAAISVITLADDPPPPSTAQPLLVPVNPVWMLGLTLFGLGMLACREQRKRR